MIPATTVSICHGFLRRVLVTTPIPFFKATLHKWLFDIQTIFSNLSQIYECAHKTVISWAQFWTLQQIALMPPANHSCILGLWLAPWSLLDHQGEEASLGASILSLGTLLGCHEQVQTNLTRQERPHVTELSHLAQAVQDSHVQWPSSRPQMHEEAQRSTAKPITMPRWPIN